MENHKDALDKKVYESLHDMEVPYEPSNWDAMEARLNALYTEEQPPAIDPVDTAVHRVLDSMEVGFNPAHWNVMAQRLETIKVLTRRIWSAKISEVAILVLLFMNWGNLLVDKPQPPQKPVFNPNIPVAEAPIQLDEQPTSTNTALLAQPENSTIEVQSTQALTTSGTSGNTTTSSRKRTFAANNASQVVAGTAMIPAKSPSTIVSDNSTPATNGVESLALQAMDNQGLVSNAELNIPSVAAFATPTVFDNLPSRELAALAHTTHRKIQVAAPVLKKRKQRYVATYAALDRTHIATPRYFNVAPYSQNVNNLSAGVLLGTKKGKMLLETGFGYASIQYDPVANFNNNRFGTALSSVDYDVISLPVRVGRSLGKHKKLSIKAFAGANLATVAQANYSYKSFPNPTPGPNPEPTPAPEVGSGLLEGGSFAENSYMNAEASLRFEHTFSTKHRSKLFIEPLYQHDIFNRSGTGPNRDRLSAFSIRAGVLTTL